MSQQDIISNFQAQIAAGYQFSGAYINMGIALLNGQVVPNSIIKAPLKKIEVRLEGFREKYRIENQLQVQSVH